MTSRIVLATSIPPKISRNDGGRRIDVAYQRLCIRSWIDCGFRVLSVNDADEIAPLAGLYPEITFVAVGRNASTVSGRKNPFVADLLQALDGAPERVVGIINSDIVLDPTGDWQRQIPQLARGAVVVGQRHDTVSLTGGVLRPFPFGFDYFFFERSGIKEVVAHAPPFALGLPWWNYWLPIALAFAGRELRLLVRPGGIHLTHDQAYQHQVWRFMGAYFIAFVTAAASRLPGAVPAGWEALVALCRGFAGSRAIANGAADKQLNELCQRCTEAIRRHPVAGPHPAEAVRHDDNRAAAGPQPDGVPSPACLFAGRVDRLQAGEWLESAILLQQQRKPQDAERLFRAVLDIAPDEWMALCNLGMIARNAGRLEEAMALFLRALPMRSTDLNLLSVLGSTSSELGRWDDAVAYFERSLAVDPRFAAGYHNLALALHALGRIPEAVKSLERALALKPDLAAAAEAHALMRQELAPPPQAGPAPFVSYR